MNKTMTIIELLNKIANGEEVPEKIKYDTKEMLYDHNKQDYLGYYSNNNGEWLFQYLFDRCKNTEHFINDFVEIIEDNDKLEKIKWNEKESRAGILRTDQEIEVLAKRTETLKKKIAELVDHINKIEEKLDEK